MYIDSFKKRYDLVEFNFYGTYVGEKATYVLEMLINCSIDGFDKNEFNEIVIVDEEQSYVFVGFEVNEYYEEDNCIKVVLVK